MILQRTKNILSYMIEEDPAHSWEHLTCTNFCGKFTQCKHEQFDKWRKSRCGTKEKGENHRRLLLQMSSKEEVTSVQQSHENQDFHPCKPLTPGHISDIKWLCWERVQWLIIQALSCRNILQQVQLNLPISHCLQIRFDFLTPKRNPQT